MSGYTEIDMLFIAAGVYLLVWALSTSVRQEED